MDNQKTEIHLCFFYSLLVFASLGGRLVEVSDETRELVPIAAGCFNSLMAVEGWKSY